MMTSPSTRERASEIPTKRGGSRLKAALTAGMPLIVLGVLAAVEFPLCPTRLAIGVPCPGCGLTRATLAGLTLDLEGLLHYHPLAPLMTPLVGWTFLKPVLRALGWVEQQTLDRLPQIPQPLYWTLGVALFGLWIARLAGLLGGHPDPIDFTDSYLYRGGHSLWQLFQGG
jgi:hypothetical protein